MVPTAAFGAAAFALAGAVEWRYAVFLGLPATAGAVFGVWMQRRISERVARLAFACFLVVVAVRLLVG